MFFGSRSVFFSISILILSAIAIADPPEGYYDRVEGLYGQQLLEGLTSITSIEHTALGYTPARDVMYSTIEDPTNTDTVEGVYSGMIANIGCRSNAQCVNSAEAVNFTAEHSWPQSQFTPDGGNPQEPMYSDLHHLFPEVLCANTHRSDHPFNEPTADFNAGCLPADTSVRGTLNGMTVFEVRDARKGNSARAMLYMIARYWNQDALFDDGFGPQDVSAEQIALYMKWHREDPVDALERLRNDAVQAAQGNRNPFVDRPEFAEYIWGGGAPPALLVGAGGLIFTEYYEAGSVKALEIYNGTGETIDLGSGYRILQYINGNVAVGRTYALTGMLPAGDVFVLATSAVPPEVLAVTDFETTLSFNGNDALTIVDPTNTVLDSIGRIGEDPGSAWTGQGVSTEDQVLRRSPAVFFGDMDSMDVFDPSAEWFGHAGADIVYTGFGSHETYTSIPNFSQDFAAGGGTANGWLGGALPGFGGLTSLSGSGLCMFVPGVGDNFVIWVSPEGLLELAANSIYSARLAITSDQQDVDAIPLFFYVYDNFLASGLGNNYGGFSWVLDVDGGAEGIGRLQGRSEFDFFFGPIAGPTPQWSAGAFTPAADLENDMRLQYRIIDANAALLTQNDSGTICVSNLAIRRYDRAMLPAFTTVFEPPIAAATHFAEAIDEIGVGGTAMIEDATNTARYMLATVGDARKTLGPFDALQPDLNSQLFPIVWEANSVYRARASIRAEASELDPIDVIFLSTDTATVELGGVHYVTRGFPGGAMDRVGSPKLAAAEYESYFYSQNATLSATPNAGRLRPLAIFFNSPTQAGDGTGGDATIVESLGVDQFGPIPQM